MLAYNKQTITLNYEPTNATKLHITINGTNYEWFELWQDMKSPYLYLLASVNFHYIIISTEKFGDITKGGFLYL